MYKVFVNRWEVFHTPIMTVVFKLHPEFCRRVTDKGTDTDFEKVITDLPKAPGDPRGPDGAQTEGWCVYTRDTRQDPDRACFSSWSGSNPGILDRPTMITCRNRTGQEHDLEG